MPRFTLVEWLILAVVGVILLGVGVSGYRRMKTCEALRHTSRTYRDSMDVMMVCDVTSRAPTTTTLRVIQ